MDQRSYSDISRADVDQIRNELGRIGVVVPEGDDVEVAGPLGIKMRASYDEKTKVLSLSILEKPGYVSEAQIWKVITMGAGRL
jgi:hypothetical protein